MKRTRLATCFFFALMISYCSSAQNSILWEISGNDLQSPSYLMGTLKFIGANEFFFPPQVHARMKQCRIFAIEDELDHHAQHELNEAVHFKGKESLRTVLSAEDYARVEKFFQSEFGIAPAKFQSHYAKLIPLALSITMTRLSLGDKVLYYDLELVKEAKKNGLDTYSLEHVRREAEALATYPIADQVRALLHSVDHFDQQKKEFQQLIADYPHGDLEKIFSYTVHPMENNAAFIEEFYYKRNEEWLPKIDKMVHDKPAFIAVGISHLEGERGLIALLRKKGYTLNPVAINARPSTDFRPSSRRSA